MDSTAALIEMNAVINITTESGANFIISFVSSIPFMPGILKSVSTISNFTLLITSNADSPSLAVETECPACSSTLFIIVTDIISSSTTRIFAIFF